MIPLFKKEVVDIYTWMNDEEFGDVLAIGNTLPGPIATKMSGYIGYKVAGLTGCIVSVLAITIPSIIGMVVFLTVLTSHKDQPWVNGIGYGVVPVVVIMMSVLTWDFFSKSLSTMGKLGTLIIGLLSFIAISSFGIHPGIVVGIFLAIALLRNEPPAKQKEESSTNESEDKS